jgi:hypothetical protein
MAGNVRDGQLMELDKLVVGTLPRNQALMTQIHTADGQRDWDMTPAFPPFLPVPPR